MDLAPQRRLAAIMFTDIVGYSRLMGADEAWAMRLLDRHDAILGEQVRAHGGEILKKMGDSVFAAVFLIVSMAMFHLVRPISKRYVFRDIRGVDEWLEWAVMELGWCAPSKRGKALQFSPSFLTALTWGWMKLSVWVDGNSITVVGPSTFVERLTRTVKATWSPADQLPRGT
jgi:hypothetical protein